MFIMVEKLDVISVFSVIWYLCGNFSNDTCYE